MNSLSSLTHKCFLRMLKYSYSAFSHVHNYTNTCKSTPLSVTVFMCVYSFTAASASKPCLDVDLHPRWEANAATYRLWVAHAVPGAGNSRNLRAY